MDVIVEANSTLSDDDDSKVQKAQTLFQQRRFEAAGRLYLELTNSSLADQYKADCYYAAGFSFLQLNDNQSAIHAFTGLIDKFPKQGTKAPWRLHQNYARDLLALRFGPIEDGVMRFHNPAPNRARLDAAALG